MTGVNFIYYNLNFFNACVLKTNPRDGVPLEERERQFFSILKKLPKNMGYYKIGSVFELWNFYSSYNYIYSYMINEFHKI